MRGWSVLNSGRAGSSVTTRCAGARPAGAGALPTAGTRFLRLITVFFMATGRGTPWSLWYRPVVSHE